MAGKMIVDRRSDARLLAGTARELSVDAAPDLAQRLAPLLRPGETLPDFAFVFELVARDLEEASASLTSKDKGFKDELDRGGSVRLRRDKAAQAVREALARIRSAVDGVYGKKTAIKVLTFDGRTGNRPELLLLKAQRVLQRLEDETFDLPGAQVPGFALDTRPWRDLLAGPAAELEAALTELSRGHGKKASRVAGKQLSLKEFDRLHQCSARLFHYLLKYAGRPELTARVRLAYHKPGSGGAEPPAPAPGDGTQGTPQAPPPGSPASS